MVGVCWAGLVTMMAVDAATYWDELMERTTRRRATMLRSTRRHVYGSLWVQANWNLLLAAQYLRHTGFGPTVTFAKLLRLGYPRASRNKRIQYVVAREFWRQFALHHANGMLPSHDEMVAFSGQLQHVGQVNDPMIVRHYFVDPSLDGSIRRAVAEHRPPPPQQVPAQHVPLQRAEPPVGVGTERQGYKVAIEDVLTKLSPDDFDPSESGDTENYSPELRRKIEAIKKQRQENSNATN